MIEHLKSGLSVSTHVGCTMSCSYCVLSSLHGFENGPRQDAQPEQLVQNLLSGRELFVNGQTPLILNNRTDPMLPSVQKATRELLEALAEAGITSPVLLISKFPPNPWLTPYFDRLRLMYIYSYSNLPGDFNHRLLEEHLKQIREYVPRESRFHYFRPIIPGQNDDPDRMLECLEKFRDAGFSGTVMTGLRITANNRNLIDAAATYDPQHKLLQRGLYPEILKRMAQAGIDYPVFRHTSCAIGAFLKRGCKLRYFGREDHCDPRCANAARCALGGGVEPEQLMAQLSARFGPDFRAEFQTDSILTIHSEITQEQSAFLKNAYGIGVEARNMVLSPSERSILGYE